MAVYNYNCIEKLCRHLRCSRYELELELLNPESRRKAYKFLERYDLFFGPTREQIFVTYFSNDAASQTMTFRGGYKNVNMDQFMLIRYHVDLKYPDLPCVVEERGRKPYYYPLETIALRPRQNENNNLHSFSVS